MIFARKFGDAADREDYLELEYRRNEHYRNADHRPSDVDGGRSGQGCLGTVAGAD